MTVIDQLGDGVFRFHYDSLQINVGVIIGDTAVLVVDSRETHRYADEIRADLRSLTNLPVGWVVNTHFHWDHTWGNARFPEAQLWGHEMCREEMLRNPEKERRRVLERASEDQRREFEEVAITPPANTFSRTTTIDVGNRSADLRYHGLGHTNSDIVIRVGDVLFAGDLIEHGAPPSFGDSYPMSWNPTLKTIEIPDVVVPGHGFVVDRDFVAAQTAEIAAVAELARNGHRDGAPIDALLHEGPYPPQTMRIALARAYAQLDDEL